MKPNKPRAPEVKSRTPGSGCRHLDEDRGPRKIALYKLVAPPRAPAACACRRPPLPDDVAGLRAMRRRVDQLLGLAEPRSGRAAAPRLPAGATDEQRTEFWRERAAAAAAAAGPIDPQRTTP
jgi:hypothetical protein